MPSKRTKPYYEKNRLLAVWLPESLNAWFEDYLQHNCQGDSKASRFRIFLFSLKALEDKGITLVNPIKDYESIRLKELKAIYGENLDGICIRGAARAGKSPRDLEFMCLQCKEQHKQEWKACMEIRQEVKNAKQQVGI